MFLVVVGIAPSPRIYTCNPPRTLNTPLPTPRYPTQRREVAYRAVHVSLVYQIEERLSRVLCFGAVK